MHYLGSQYLLQEIINRNTFLVNSLSLKASFPPDFFFSLNYLYFTILHTEITTEICYGFCTAKEEESFLFEVPVSIHKFANKVRMHKTTFTNSLLKV